MASLRGRGSRSNGREGRVSGRVVRLLAAIGVTAAVATSPAAAAPGSGVGQGSGAQTGNVITAGVTYRSGGAEGGGGSDCTWELRDDQWVGDVGPGDPVTVD